MVHLHSCEARKRRREKAILKGYITAAKSCKQISPPGLEFAAVPRKSVEPDPWDIEDPWSLGRKAANNCVIGTACLPPCPPPTVPPPSTGCEDASRRLNALAQDFTPKLMGAEFTQNSDKLLESAMALIEMQNSSIAWLMQMLSSTGKTVTTQTSWENEIQAAKEVWKAETKTEIENMMGDLQKSMRDTLDKKDTEIQALREALEAKSSDQKHMESGTPIAAVPFVHEKGETHSGNVLSFCKPSEKSQPRVEKHDDCEKAAKSVVPHQSAMKSYCFKFTSSLSSQQAEAPAVKEAKPATAATAAEAPKRESIEYIPLAGDSQLFSKLWINHACVGRCIHCEQSMAAVEDAYWCHGCNSPLHASFDKRCAKNHRKDCKGHFGSDHRSAPDSIVGGV